MAYKITVPFPVFTLEFGPNHHFIMPLHDTVTLRYGQSVSQLAAEYQQAFQKAMYQKGAIDLLKEYQVETFQKDQITINFSGAKDGIRYPEFTIAFDIYIHHKDDAFWGILPVLGIQSYAKTYDKLLDRFAETVQVDFARFQRGRYVKQLLELLWYKGTTLSTPKLEIDVPNLGEENSLTESSHTLLPTLATKLKAEKGLMYGRHKELDQIKRSLSSHFSQNILLVGPSGVGKSALIVDVVRLLPQWGIELAIWETTASAMMKALVDDRSWEFNISRLVQELKGSSNILFIKSLMDLFEVGKYEGNDVSMGAFLQPFLNRGELRLITECTNQEFSVIELNNPNYLSSFQVIRIEQPQGDELLKMIDFRIARQAKALNIQVDTGANEEAVRLSQRFTPYAGLPGRPIRFLENLMLNHQSSSYKRISKIDVIQHFCAESGMPSFMVDPSVPMEPQAIQRSFNDQVFSQENAVASVVDAMAAVKTALTRKGKPIASFLFVGPTGVGKTELAKILAEFLFGHRNRMLRFDMSEYSSPVSILRLTGGLRPGEDGLLTAAVRRQPFSVLLFDEIEKADESFYDLLLQLLSEGRLTDSQGNLANFCSTLIIMTSNIGSAQRLTKPIQLTDSDPLKHESEHYQKAVQQHFRPELYNRIDRIIPFQSLDKDTVRFVIDREIKKILNREGVKFRKLQLDIKDGVLEHIVKTGYNSLYGARHLQRNLRQKLVIPLAEKLNTYEADDQIQLVVMLDGENIKLEATADPLAIELLIEELKKQQDTNYCSTLRGDMQKFITSYLFTLIQQEIDRFDVQIRSEKEAFWKNKQAVDRYTLMVELRNKSFSLKEEINEIENDLSLMVLDLIPYRPSLETAIDNWSESFFDLQLNVFSALHPEKNRCFFHIYGDNPEQVAKWYIDLFEYKNYIYTISALYIRDSQYQLYVADQNRPPAQRAEVQPFIRRNISYRMPDFSPEQDNDKLVGVQFTVAGKAVLTFLESEMGGQSWHLNPDDEKEKRVSVQVLEHYEQAPVNIMRKDFVKKAEIRRTFSQNHFKDLHYRVSREMDWEKVFDRIISELDSRFRRKIKWAAH